MFVSSSQFAVSAILVSCSIFHRCTGLWSDENSFVAPMWLIFRIFFPRALSSISALVPLCRKIVGSSRPKTVKFKSEAMLNSFPPLALVSLLFQYPSFALKSPMQIVGVLLFSKIFFVITFYDAVLPVTVCWGHFDVTINRCFDHVSGNLK